MSHPKNKHLEQHRSPPRTKVLHPTAPSAHEWLAESREAHRLKTTFSACNSPNSTEPIMEIGAPEEYYRKFNSIAPAQSPCWEENPYEDIRYHAPKAEADSEKSMRLRADLGAFYVCKGFFDFGSYVPELIENEGKKEMGGMVKGEASDELMGEMAKRVIEGMVEGKKGVKGKIKETEENLGGKIERELKSKKLEYEVDEWEELEEGEEKNKHTTKVKWSGADKRNYIRAISSNYYRAPMQCGEDRWTDMQLDLLNHHSQQTFRPGRLKSQWILVNDFAKDGEEFVFVEKDV